MQTRATQGMKGSLVRFMAWGGEGVRGERRPRLKAIRRHRKDNVSRALAQRRTRRRLRPDNLVAELQESGILNLESAGRRGDLFLTAGRITKPSTLIP